MVGAGQGTLLPLSEGPVPAALPAVEDLLDSSGTALPCTQLIPTPHSLQTLHT
ncbi:Uncharacterised protein [Chlamydia trachomatis]|nr:Uncharacterised protein [Chlamydia trachomatis]